MQVLHQLQNPIDYRPQPQHHLYTVDESFDFRFSACNRIESMYTWLYNQTLLSENASILNKVKKLLAPKIADCQSESSSQSESSHVDMIMIRSSLNGLDQIHLVDTLVDHIEQQIHKSPVNVVVRYDYKDMNHSQGASAHQMFSDLYYLLYKKYTVLLKNRMQTISGTSKQTNSSSEGIVGRSFGGFLRLHSMPRKKLRDEEEIMEILSHVKYFVIVINDIDAVRYEVLQAFVRGLIGYPTQICIVGLMKSFSPCPHRLDHGALSIIKYKEYDTVSPLDLYEDYMRRILTADFMGPNIPVRLLSKLRMKFQSQHRCLHSFMKR